MRGVIVEWVKAGRSDQTDIHRKFNPYEVSLFELFKQYDYAWEKQQEILLGLWKFHNLLLGEKFLGKNFHSSQ
jgi:hypothetical protein